MEINITRVLVPAHESSNVLGAMENAGLHFLQHRFVQPAPIPTSPCSVSIVILHPSLLCAFCALCVDQQAARSAPNFTETPGPLPPPSFGGSQGRQWLLFRPQMPATTFRIVPSAVSSSFRRPRSEGDGPHYQNVCRV